MASNGTEDGAVAKDKAEHLVRSRSNNARDSRRSIGGLRNVSPIVAKPPSLLAAVFPWDHAKYETRTTTSTVTKFMPEEGQIRRQSPVPFPKLARLERFVADGFAKTTGRELGSVKNHGRGAGEWHDLCNRRRL
ncbi:hypothetical protein PIB30_063244 [Stylosanthes scabra]|uniref:Uncharacterized protein n=1 Tax=Stylosanthes scabra TaxID=79078 RepID=A0ABU6YIV5_9FABA|nr:hypothetical protein [Stylosanthes scabra]